MLDSIEQDVAEAMYIFADCNPSDTLVVGELQARVHRLIYLQRTLNTIAQAGDAAAAAIQAEDGNHMDDDE